MTDIWKDLYKVSFGKALAEKRKAKKLSIRKLSALAGISASYLSYIERGIHGPPSMAVTIQLAEALKADKDELLAKAGHVSEEVSKAYQKNPKEVSEAARDSFEKKGLGVILGIALLLVALNGGLDFGDEEEELPEPEEAFKELKENYLTDDTSPEKEKEYFDYCTALIKCWKNDMKQRDKEKK
jgi:transcriptional regulator with XRE-family HTH domain